MNLYSIALVALFAPFFTLDSVHAQSGGIGFPRHGDPTVPGVGFDRNGTTLKKESDKKKERKKTMDDNKKRFGDKKKKFDDYNKDQQKTQGSDYRKGKIYDPNRGDYIDDRHYNRLNDEMDHAQKMYNTSKQLYDDEK